MSDTNINGNMDGNENEDTGQHMFMTFQCGKEAFGIEIKYIEEIIQYQSITTIPEVEEYIKGLINLRGKIIPVIDVRMRFGMEPLEYNDRTCIIVINVDGIVVGLIIESIAKVVSIDEADILPPPSLSHAEKQNKYVYGIGKTGDKVKLLLDPNRLVKDVDIENVAQMNSVSE